MILKCLVLFLNYLVAKKYDTAKLILTTPSNRKLSTKGNLLNEKEKDNELFEFYYIGDNEHTTSNFGLVSSTGKLMGKEDGKITLLSNFEYEELLKDYLFCKTPENKDDPKCNKEKSKDKKDKDKKKGKNDKLEKEEEPEYDEDKGEDEDKTKEKKKKNEDNTENTIDKIPKEEILLFSPRVDDSKGWGIAIANTNFCLEHIQNNVKISECPPLGFGGENFRWKFNMKYNQNTKKQFENGLLNSENYDHLAKTPKKKKRFKKINQSPPSTTLLVQQQIPISQDQTHIQPPMIAQETQPQPMNMIQQPQTEIQLNQPVQKNIKKRKYDEYEDDEDQSEDNENNQKRVHVKDQDTEDKDEDNISEEIEIIRKKPQRKRRFTEQRPAQKIFISNPENQQQNVVYETNQQQQNPPVNFVFQQPQQQQPNALNQSSLLGNIASSTPAGMGANLLAGGINSLSRGLPIF